MSAKYSPGQRVKIIFVKNQHLEPKYPELEKYINESAIILSSFLIGGGTRHNEQTGVKEVHPQFWFYTVRLEKDGSKLKSVSEDALEAID